MVYSLGLIRLVAASGHNYLALIRQEGLNPLTIQEIKSLYGKFF